MIITNANQLHYIFYEFICICFLNSGAFEEFKFVIQVVLGFIREMHLIVCRHGVTENGFFGICRNCRDAVRGEVLKDHINYINHLLENAIDPSSSSIEDKVLPALRLKLVEKATGCLDGESGSVSTTYSGDGQ